MAAAGKPEPGHPGIAIRALFLVLPFLILALHLALLFLLLPPAESALVVGLMTAYVLPPAGKETVIPIGIALGIPWWLMAMTIALIDIETGLFMAYNFDLAYRIPVFGPWLAGFTRSGQDFITTHTWIRKLYLAGIVLLVGVPFFGSGGIRGSVIGRLLGMDQKQVFVAIVIGAVAGCLLIALFSDALIGAICTSGLVPADAVSRACDHP